MLLIAFWVIVLWVVLTVVGTTIAYVCVKIMDYFFDKVDERHKDE